MSENKNDPGGMRSWHSTATRKLKLQNEYNIVCPFLLFAIITMIGAGRIYIYIAQTSVGDEALGIAFCEVGCDLPNLAEVCRRHGQCCHSTLKFTGASCHSLGIDAVNLLTNCCRFLPKMTVSPGLGDRLYAIIEAREDTLAAPTY